LEEKAIFQSIAVDNWQKIAIVCLFKGKSYPQEQVCFKYSKIYNKNIEGIKKFMLYPKNKNTTVNHRLYPAWVQVDAVKLNKIMN
jgi:hypothetical protein